MPSICLFDYYNSFFPLFQHLRSILLKMAVSNCKFETAPRVKKPTVGFFTPGICVFSRAKPSKMAVFSRQAKPTGLVGQMHLCILDSPFYVKAFRRLGGR